MLLTGSRFLEARSFENMYFLYILKGKTMFPNQKMCLKGVLVTRSTHQKSSQYYRTESEKLLQ